MHIEGTHLHQRWHVVLVQFGCLVKGRQRSGKIVQGEVHLTEVLQLRGVTRCQAYAFARSIECIIELMQLQVACTELPPGVGIPRLLSSPFGGVEHDDIPVARFFQRLNARREILARSFIV